MSNKASLYLALAILVTSYGATSSSSPAPAQSAVHEKNRIKEFGSSLQRLKWDPRKNAAVETKSKQENVLVSDEEDVVRVETSLVVCDVLVFDKQGHQVRGLTQTDFVVTEDGKPERVSTFAPADDKTRPRSIVLILDYSLNQSGFLETSIEAAKMLVDELNPRDRMAIVSDQIKLLIDFTDDKQKLKVRLASLRDQEQQVSVDYATSSGGYYRDNWFRSGAHFSALLATLKELFNQEDQRPIVILQANGNEASLLQNSILPDPPPPPTDLPSKTRKQAQEIYQRTRRKEAFISNVREFSLDDVYRAAQRSRATIYTIIPGYRLIGLTQNEQLERAKAWSAKYRMGWSDATASHGLDHSRSNLEQTPDWMWGWVAECVLREQTALAVLATITGGWTDFVEEPSQAVMVYDRILQNMNSRYVIGYYPTNKERDGKTRKISIQVAGHSDYLVLGRNSYLAPGP